MKRIITIALILVIIVNIYFFLFSFGRILTPYQTKKIWQKIHAGEVIKGENDWYWLKVITDGMGIIFKVREKKPQPNTVDLFIIQTDKHTKPLWIFEDGAIGFRWKGTRFQRELKRNIQDII